MNYMYTGRQTIREMGSIPSQSACLSSISEEYRGQRRIRVLHVYKTCWSEGYGGIEQAIRQLCLATRRKEKVRNYVFTLSRNGTPHVSRNHQAAIIRFPLMFEVASTGVSWRAMLSFRQIAREMDIIHYHFPWPFADLLHLLNGVDKPAVMTYHSDIVRQRRWLPFYKPLLKRFLGGVDRIVATSPNYFKTSQTLNSFCDKTSVIPFGLDESSYSKVSKERLDYWRKRVGSGFFLFIGVLRYYKGLHKLLDACSGTDIRVAIGGIGPMEESLQSRLSSSAFENVYLLGSLSEEDKVALISLCRSLVLPSHLRSEAFGFSLLEAAMFGKPMISSEIGTGTSYINIHNETGIVVPPNDTRVLREAMVYLNEKPEIAEKMGLQARMRYQELFTAPKMASSYLNVYHAVLKKRANNK